MRKVLTIGLVAVLVIVIAGVALAIGPGYVGGMGPCYGMRGSNLTPEQPQKYAQFQKDILPLRQKMLQFKTELMTLRTQTTPDWKAIAEKQKEMIDLRTEIQKKASGAGLTAFGPGMCGRGGMGMGMGRMGM